MKESHRYRCITRQSKKFLYQWKLAKLHNILSAYFWWFTVAVIQINKICNGKMQDRKYLSFFWGLLIAPNFVSMAINDTWRPTDIVLNIRVQGYNSMMEKFRSWLSHTAICIFWPMSIILSTAFLNLLVT